MRQEKRTIFLDVIPVLDTLRYHDIERNVDVDTLVLSMDETSEVISNEDFAISLIAGGGQNIVDIPERLYYRNKKLFLLDKNGKVIKKRRRAILSKKKYPQHFIEVKENK